MQPRTVRHIFFLAACIAATAACARTDIVKCVDPAGHVTLSDQPCGAGSDTVLLSANTRPAAAQGEPAGAPPASGITRIVTTDPILAPARPAAARHANGIQKAASEHALARDVATLKAARASLQSMDSGRNPHLAGLN